MRPRQGRYRVEYARGFASDGGMLLSGPDFWIDFEAPGRYFPLMAGMTARRQRGAVTPNSLG
jgi:hypothetical protein